MSVYTIQIKSEYTNLDEATLDDYLHNIFLGQFRDAEALAKIKKDKTFTFETSQPDGKGKAKTVYNIIKQ